MKQNNNPSQEESPERSMWSSIHQSLLPATDSIFTYRSLRTYRTKESECQEETLRISRSIRSLLYEIEERAKKNVDPPEYVSDLEALPPRLLSWNAKKLRPLKGVKRKKINIIGNCLQFHDLMSLQFPVSGCHQSLELVLAKADARSRKQKLVLEKAQDAYRSLHGTIMMKISHKHQRKNEMIQQSNIIKQNALFLKIIYFINFASRLEERYRETYTLHHWRNFQNRSATRSVFT